MPAVSKQQFKLMAMIANGQVKKPGLTPQKAREYLTGNYKKLPERKGKI